jgi:hypothetical protein
MPAWLSGEKAAKDIGELVGGKWNNHPLAMELGMALYSYLEKKCKDKSAEVAMCTGYHRRWPTASSKQAVNGLTGRR